MAHLTVEGLPAEPAADATDVLDTPEAGARFLRGGSVRLAGYAAMVLLSVLSAALLTRHLGPARFSQYTTVISLVTLVAAVTDAGMSQLGTREFSVRRGADREELMRDLLGLRMALTLAGVVLATAFALAAGYDAALVAGTLVASLGTVALVVQHTYTIPLSAQMRLVSLSGLELGRQVLLVGGIVALVLAGAGLLPLLSVTPVVNLLLIPPTVWLAGRAITLRLARPNRRWLALLGSTITFSLATAVGTVYVYTAQITTSLAASPRQSGLFAASFRVFIVVAAIPGLLVGAALPVLARASRDDRDRLAYALQRIFEMSLILGVAAAVAVLGGAHFAIEVIAGPHYAPATEPLQILGVAMIASFVLSGWGYALISLHRHTALLLVNALALAVSLGLTIALAAAHGAVGAAVATLCGETVLAAGMLLAVVRAEPALRPGLRVPLSVSAAAAPAVLLALLAPAPSLARAAVAVAAFVAGVLLLRAVPEEMLALARGRGARE